MDIDIRMLGKYQAITVREEITHANVREFFSYLDRIVEDGAVDLILDLNDVPYITSRGLGAIVSTYTVLRKRGGNLVVLGPQEEVLRSLELTQLNRILEIATSDQEAVSKLQA